METPETAPVAAEHTPVEPAVLSVPDMLAQTALVLAAINEIAHRAQEIYDSLHGISAPARADIAFALAMFKSAQSQTLNPQSFPLPARLNRFQPGLFYDRYVRSFAARRLGHTHA